MWHRSDLNIVNGLKSRHQNDHGFFCRADGLMFRLRLSGRPISTIISPAASAICRAPRWTPPLPRRIPGIRMRRRSGLRRLGLVPAKRDLECLDGWDPKVFGHHPEPILAEMQVFADKKGRDAKYSACDSAISILLQPRLDYRIGDPIVKDFGI